MVGVFLTKFVLFLQRPELITDFCAVGGYVRGQLVNLEVELLVKGETCPRCVFDGHRIAWRLGKLKRKSSIIAFRILDRLQRARLVGNPGRGVLLVGRVPAAGGVRGAATGPRIVVLVRVVTVAMIMTVTVAMAVVVVACSGACSSKSGGEDFHLF